MNWGKGIVIGMVLFMSFIITLVIIMMSNDTDLVSEDYYQKELAYNEQYNAQQNYMNAGESIELNIIKDTFFLSFPSKLRTGKVDIELKRPNNKNQDATFTVDAQEKVMIPTALLPKGAFDCTLKGTFKGKPYEFVEQIILE
jgi:nitrogen fixation protein FixH